MPYKDVSKQREATRKSTAKWKISHPKEHRSRSRRYAAVRYAKRKAFLNQLKDKPCGDCKQRFPPYVLDFHHRDPESKVDAVAKMFAENCSLDTLLEEIDKCDLLCANCHRIRHHG